MKAAYIYGANVDVKGYGPYLDMAVDMLRSFAGHATCDTVFCCWDGLDASTERRLRSAWSGELVLNDLSEFGFPPGLHYTDYRVLALQRVPLEDGDELLRLECDTLFAGDPFDCFDWEFDIGFAQRAYWRGFNPTNMGFAAIRGGPLGRGFVNEWANEVLTPTLPMMLALLEAGRKLELPWTREETYPWAVLKHTTGNCRFAVLPCEFNWFPFDDLEMNAPKSRKVFRDKYLNPGNVRMFHFKGPDKSTMKELAGLR